MDTSLHSRITRRKEEMNEFYYRSLGEWIRRGRLKRQLTQEALAKGICSNTYISKIENNKIAVNQDHLFLIMEKMGVPQQNIGLPEKMVENLEKSIQYFYYRDLEAYASLVHAIEKYTYGILIFVIRLGYYVLIENFDEAKKLYEMMDRYFNSLEDFGFTTFLIYGCFYHVGRHDYLSARLILESAKDKLTNNEPLFALYAYLRFIVYGELHLFNRARDGLETAKQLFFNHGNAARLSEAMALSRLYRLYEKDPCTDPWCSRFGELLSGHRRNLGLIVFSRESTHPLDYLDRLDETSDFYATGLFFKALYLFESKDVEAYERVKETLASLIPQSRQELDYLQTLTFIEDGEELFLKDYLVHYALPLAESIQSIYFHALVTQTISRILTAKKRYKDSKNYLQKHQAYVESLQKGHHIKS